MVDFSIRIGNESSPSLWQGFFNQVLWKICINPHFAQLIDADNTPDSVIIWPNCDVYVKFSDNGNILVDQFKYFCYVVITR